MVARVLTPIAPGRAWNVTGAIALGLAAFLLWNRTEHTAPEWLVDVALVAGVVVSFVACLPRHTNERFVLEWTVVMALVAMVGFVAILVAWGSPVGVAFGLHLLALCVALAPLVGPPARHARPAALVVAIGICGCAYAADEAAPWSILPLALAVPNVAASAVAAAIAPWTRPAGASVVVLAATTVVLAASVVLRIAPIPPALDTVARVAVLVATTVAIGAVLVAASRPTSTAVHLELGLALLAAVAAPSEPLAVACTVALGFTITIAAIVRAVAGRRRHAAGAVVVPRAVCEPDGVAPLLPWLGDDDCDAVVVAGSDGYRTTRRTLGLTTCERSRDLRLLASRLARRLGPFVVVAVVLTAASRERLGVDRLSCDGGDQTLLVEQRSGWDRWEVRANGEVMLWETDGQQDHTVSGCIDPADLTDDIERIRATVSAQPPRVPKVRGEIERVYVHGLFEGPLDCRLDPGACDAVGRLLHHVRTLARLPSLPPWRYDHGGVE
jgi:hypothetical protein